MASVIEQLRARDARLIVMVNEGDPLLTSPGAKGCKFIEVRTFSHEVQGRHCLMPHYIVADHIASTTLSLSQHAWPWSLTVSLF
jgi:hypothetical protein